MNDTVIIAVLSLIGTFFGSLSGVITSAKLTNFRLKQLENCLRYCTISRNSTGNMAKLAQFCVGAFPDGKAGIKTQNAIITWQKSNGLTPDGIFGYQCWKKAISKGA